MNIEDGWLMLIVFS